MSKMERQIVSTVAKRKEQGAVHVIGAVFYTRRTWLLRRTAYKVVHEVHYLVPEDDAIVECTVEAVRRELNGYVEGLYYGR